MEMHIEVQNHKAELITKLLEHIPFVKIKEKKPLQEQQNVKPVEGPKKGKCREPITPTL